MFFKREGLPKFIVTKELGRLARWLRILGFDCVFFNKARQRDIVIESLRQERIILTRETKLSRFSGFGKVHIKSDFVEEQLSQIISSLRLKVDKRALFTRCVECNTPIEKLDKKETLESKVPPYVYKTQDEFMTCPTCQKIYWKGTHFDLANKFLAKAKLKLKVRVEDD